MNKWAVLDAEYTGFDGERMRVFDPHDGQLKIMESDARMKVASCGRRFGKSNLGGHEFIPWAMRAKREAAALKAQGRRREFWIVGPEYADAEKEFRVFYDKAIKLGFPFDRPGTYYSVATGDMSISLWDGAFILTAKSEGRPTSLVGEALSGVIMAEAAKMKESTWTQLIRPALSDFKGWGLFTTTPEGKNWLYRLYIKAIEPENVGWDGFRMPSWYNPHVFTEPTSDYDVKRLMRLMNDNPGLTSFEIIRKAQLKIDPEIAQMANDLTIPMFQQEVAADFTDFVGKVFGDFDSERHCRHLPFNPSWETVAAVDYGFTNPNVWLLIQIGPWGEINVVDEFHEPGLTADEFAREILRRGLCPDNLTEFYPDPASPGDTKILETLFRKAGKRAQARPHTGGELKDRLDIIRLALKNNVNDTELNRDRWRGDVQEDLRRPQLMFSTRCTKTIDEFEAYRYPKKKDENVEDSTKRYELPLKKDDHAPEALGRFMIGKYHSAATQYGTGTKISKARFLGNINGRGYNQGVPPGHPDAIGVAKRRTQKQYGTWLGD